MLQHLKRLVLVLLAAVLLVPVPPASAESISCNLDLVVAGVCRSATNLAVCYDSPTPRFVELRDALVVEHNYSPELICANTRQWHPLLNGGDSGVLTAAGASSDGCTVGQVVANPQSKAAFADAQILLWLQNKVIAYNHQNALEQQEVTSIPTPDLGGSGL